MAEMADEREQAGRHVLGVRVSGITRRQFIGIGAGTVAAALLAACGASNPTATPAAATKPAATTAAGGTTPAATAASGGATPAATTAAAQATTAAPAAAKKGEFHGAWPYDLPPKGHYNTMNGIPSW